MMTMMRHFVVLLMIGMVSCSTEYHGSEDRSELENHDEKLPWKTTIGNNHVLDEKFNEADATIQDEDEKEERSVSSGPIIDVSRRAPSPPKNLPNPPQPGAEAR